MDADTPIPVRARDEQRRGFETGVGHRIVFGRCAEYRAAADA